MHVAGCEGTEVIVLLACMHAFCKDHCVAYQFSRNGMFNVGKYLSIGS